MKSKITATLFGILTTMTLDAKANVIPYLSFFNQGLSAAVRINIGEGTGELPKTSILIRGEYGEVYRKIFRQRVGENPKVNTKFAGCEAETLTGKEFVVLDPLDVKLVRTIQFNSDADCRQFATEINLKNPFIGD